MASKYIRVQGNLGESPFFAKYFDMFEIEHLVFIMNSFFVDVRLLLHFALQKTLSFYFLHEGCYKRVNQSVLEPFTALIRPRIAIERKNEILKNLNLKRCLSEVVGVVNWICLMERCRLQVNRSAL